MHTDILNQVEQKYGRLIASINPDVFLGFAIASLVDSYAYSFTPLAINGASHHSGGTAGKNSASSSSAPDSVRRFFSENSHAIHHSLPAYEHGVPPLVLPIFVHEAYLQANPDLESESMETLAEWMVRQVLVAPESRQRLPYRWLDEFIELNNYNIKIKSPWQLWPERFRLRSRRLLQKLATVRSSHICEEKFNSISLGDVYQASIAAREIILHGVSFRERFASLIRAATSRLLN